MASNTLLRSLSPIIALFALRALPAAGEANAVIAPTEIKATGTYTHASGLAFPTTLGSLERTRIVAFPEAKDNVGVTYRSAGDHPVVLTIFAYPVLDATFDAHFEHVLNDVRETHHAEPQQKAKTSTDTPKGTLHTGLATFLFAEPFVGGKEPEALLSRLSLFQRGTWLVKYRITSRTTDQAVADDVLRKSFQVIGIPP